ncbi:MAG: MFS transporter [Alphaproteobacteria bacterium]|nr:MFS transporter [Alphaproteobacteria bacterium]
MTHEERRSALSLAAVFSVRLLGLFMIYPVFAGYAGHLQDASPALTGLALGIYGLTQGLLQIPFGLLSDRIGRKTMIVTGLLIFAAGSAVAATSTSVVGVVIGRALQGGGAVGSVVLALVADLTREEHRTSAMAMVGITIGMSFVVALVAGPLVAGLIGVAGIFWLMVGLAVVGILITLFVVPHPPTLRLHRDAEAVPSMLGRVLVNTELLRLDYGIFALHAMLTASFLVMPQLLSHGLGVTSDEQWYVYLPVLLLSVAVMVPSIIVAEKYRRMKAVFVAAVITLAASQMLLLAAANNTALLILALIFFFAGFNVMEASLPSLVTKTAPPDAKGTATGVYSSSQFLGIFVGGALGGWIHQASGDVGVFALTSLLAGLWLVLAITMKQPSYLTTRLIRLPHAADADVLARKLRSVRGVAEAVVVVEDGLAYLKVDSKVFDADAAEMLAGAA